MGNGRGKLDCVYCTHFIGDWPHEAAQCRYHQTSLPPSELNRICCHFEASPRFAEEAGAARTLFSPVARQFTWFGADLEPGVLYEFPYNSPPDVQKLAVLREPATEGWGWKPPKTP